MGEKVFPSLSTTGYISDRNIIITKMLHMFIDSDENQSNYYNIKSFKYIIANNTEGYETANAIKLGLTSLCSSYFDTVNVDVTYEFLTEKSFWVYSISITAVYNGTTYELKKEIANNILIGE